MIILTGANGFIGKAFRKKLGVDVLIYKVEERNAFSFLKRFDEWKKVELIIHQGAISSTIEKDINKIHKYNVDFTLRLFEKAIEYQIPVKYASSASIYGNTRQSLLPSTENKISPLNYYAISKLQIDYFVLDNIDKFKLIQGFRYFNVYGEGEEHKGDQASPVHKFTKQIKETGKLKLFEGSDKFLRDFIYVGDIVDIVLHNNKPSGIYDLGTSHPISFQHVGEAVAKMYQGKIDYIPFPDHLKGKYQTFTMAKNEWEDYDFTSMSAFLLADATMSRSEAT